MLSKLSNIFAIFKNLDKLKGIAQSSYLIIIKVLALLQFLDTESDDTPLGAKLDKYLPAAISALSKVKEYADKYGSYVGITPTAVALSKETPEQILKELKNL